MKKSKIGIALVSLYIPTTIGLWVYMRTCTGFLCGLELMFSMIPWVLILENYVEFTNSVIFIILIINSFILYGLGWLISLLIKKIKN